MREIEFRGKALNNGEWVQGLLLHRNNKTFIHFYDVNKFECMYEIQPESVGQYTGLKDVNNKKIYEGDIVKCLEVSESITREYVSEVFFEDGSWLVHESETCDVYLFLYDNTNPTKMPLTEIEVIGIYES